MVFSSLSFLYAFFPVVVCLYYLNRNRTYRNVVLLVASLLFYAWGEPRYILVMLLSAAVAYLGGLAMATETVGKSRGGKKAVLTLEILVLVGLLVVFKYLNLLMGAFSSLFSIEISVPQLVLPIGISFYTFQILSYIIDLYRGKVALQKNFFSLLLYVCFFPQLIAGPIVRYETVEQELRHRQENRTDFVAGMERFIYGLAKKVLLANHLALVVDGVYACGIGSVGTIMCWVAVICYALQIYFDFSGYSDMAIGIGFMFGFHFPENFRDPYLATSVTDFWRRWHISLSTWFRDYIYIPLGGNRVPAGRHICNILITWALTGFWHGAQWSFLLWGLYYGLLLLLEKYCLSRLLEKTPMFLRRIYTLLLVLIGWVIFYNESLPQIAETLRTMFIGNPTHMREVFVANSKLAPALLSLPVAVLFCGKWSWLQKLQDSASIKGIALRQAWCIFLLGLCIVTLLSATYNPFIYFRF